MFKQFDIDYNKITIDGFKFYKPTYVSIKEWLDFWDQFNSEEIQRQIDQAWHNGAEESEKEHDKEIEEIQRQVDKAIDTISNSFIDILEDRELNLDEKIDSTFQMIDKVKFNLWR